ncbi:hypothetical protein FACS1894102_7080 [Spirochaetia bacterium]|nr:hypothetical protein FACS1894102_7080 [Spirochaetia bacterium]
MNNAYPAMKMTASKISENSALVVFSFSKNVDDFDFLENSDCFDNLQSLITKKQSETLRTQRVIRIFAGNSLIIVKPAKLRYWIRSTAVRDVDDVIIDIMRGGK